MKATIEVLLVDDNPGDMDLAADVLSRNNCPSRIHSVVDGAEAMAFLHRTGAYTDALRPHLIMLDLNMPRKDGFSVLVEAKSDPELRKIPIVIFSASLADGDIARSYHLGANNYVGKPGDLSAFVAAVTAIGDFWFGVASVPGRSAQ
jgi:two-component system, chemotaxis family, response regulator Rcp1